MLHGRTNSASQSLSYRHAFTSSAVSLCCVTLLYRFAVSLCCLALLSPEYSFALQRCGRSCSASWSCAFRGWLRPRYFCGETEWSRLEPQAAAGESLWHVAGLQPCCYCCLALLSLVSHSAATAASVTAVSLCWTFSTTAATAHLSSIY